MFMIIFLKLLSINIIDLLKKHKNIYIFWYIKIKVVILQLLKLYTK